MTNIRHTLTRKKQSVIFDIHEPDENKHYYSIYSNQKKQFLTFDIPYSDKTIANIR